MEHENNIIEGELGRIYNGNTVYIFTEDTTFVSYEEDEWPDVVEYE